jgi:hypothetical protein
MGAFNFSFVCAHISVILVALDMWFAYGYTHRRSPR